MVKRASSIHPLLWIAQQMTRPGLDEPQVIDREASLMLERALREYAAKPDLADGIRALGEFASSLAGHGSRSAAREVVRVLEAVGPELERRFDAGEIAAALDDVSLYATEPRTA
jgi:hypothetical protein